MKSNKQFTLRQLIMSFAVYGKQSLVFSYINNKDNKDRDEGKKLTIEQTKKAYMPVITELMSKPITKIYDMPFCVRYQKDWFDKKEYIEIVFLNKNFIPPKKGLKPWGCRKGEKPPKGYYDVNNNKYNKYYAIGWISWAKIIDTPVVLEGKAKKLSHAAILGEILWELTFNGWTEKECEEKGKFIKEKLKKADKEIKEGKCIEIPPKKKGQYKIVIPDCVAGELEKIVSRSNDEVTGSD